MDTFALIAAFGPLVIYLLMVGAILCFRRPFVTTGARDTVALAIGVSGVVFIGPLQLFFPATSMMLFGLFTWFMLGTFYFLCISLVVMNMRPRLVVYGASPADVRPALADAAAQLDDECQIAADSVYLPKSRLRLRVESAHGRSCCDVVLVSGVVSQTHWNQMAAALQRSLAGATGRGLPSGILLIACGLVIGGFLTAIVLRTPDEVVEGFRTLIRL